MSQFFSLKWGSEADSELIELVVMTYIFFNNPQKEVEIESG